jgi:hypothetical protein
VVDVDGDGDLSALLDWIGQRAVVGVGVQVV